MPAITIPKEHSDGLAKILSLSLDESHSIVNALGTAKSQNMMEIAPLIQKAVPSLTPKESWEIGETLTSLYSARTGLDVTVDNFVKDLIVAAKRMQVEDQQPMQVVNSNLTELLSVRPLSMLSKARGIHVDHENIFCAARILTDMRPVFDTDVSDPPVGCVIAHILKLGYHHSGEHKSIYIAMDKRDIDSLITALERAKDKAASVMANSSFSILLD